MPEQNVYSIEAEHVVCREERIPIAWRGDVLVCGGGSGGIAAAIVANRIGLSTMLVEELSFLGGMASYGAGMPMGYTTSGISNGGIAEELIDAVKNAGLDSGDVRERGVGVNVHPDSEFFKMMIARLFLKENVPVRLHTMTGDVIMDGPNRVAGVIVQSKSGRQAMLAKTVIDATGDGDIVAQTGAPYVKGRPEDGEMMAATLVFIAADVDIPKFEAYQKTDPYLKEAKARAEVNGESISDDEQVRFLNPGAKPNTLHCNTVHIRHVDGTDIDSLTHAELESYDRVYQLIRFLRGYVPGCERCYASSIGARIGIRDTRRIVGTETLTIRDKETVRKRRNVILRNAGPTDDALRGGDRPKADAQKIDPNQWFDIPYGVIVPQGIENLLIACRAFSADHLAHSGSRGIGLMMSLGQAAANAALISQRDGVSVQNINVRKLQQMMIDQGCYLGDVDDEIHQKDGIL